MRAIGLAVAVTLACSPALAQQSGIGIGQSSSTANSASTAIGGGAAQATGGQGGQGGLAGGGNGGQSSLTINSGGDQLIRQEGGTISHLRTTGTSRVLVPPATSIGMAASGIENCGISTAAAASFPGGSISIGLPTVDRGCDARNDSKVLWQMGLRAAALGRMCLRDEIRQILPECERYAPTGRAVAVAAPVAAPLVAADANPALPPGVTMVVRRSDGREMPCANFDGRRCLRWYR